MGLGYVRWRTRADGPASGNPFRPATEENFLDEFLSLTSNLSSCCRGYTHALGSDLDEIA